MYNATRNDVKQLAVEIETLAKKLQADLDSNGDFLAPANELVRNNTTLIFALGEVYAMEQSGANKKVRATTVSNPNKTSRTYLRDSSGRFASKP